MQERIPPELRNQHSNCGPGLHLVSSGEQNAPAQDESNQETQTRTLSTDVSLMLHSKGSRINFWKQEGKAQGQFIEQRVVLRVAIAGLARNNEGGIGFSETPNPLQPESHQT